MDMRQFALAAALILSACQASQQGAALTAGDLISAAAIATASGQLQDASCWSQYATVFGMVEKQLAKGSGGAASVIALHRGLAAIAAQNNCFGITSELLIALSKIPYGGAAITVLGF